MNMTYGEVLKRSRSTQSTQFRRKVGIRRRTFRQILKQISATLTKHRKQHPVVPTRQEARRLGRGEQVVADVRLSVALRESMLTDTKSSQSFLKLA